MDHFNEQVIYVPVFLQSGSSGSFHGECEGTGSTTLNTDFFLNKDSDGIYYTFQDKLKYMGYW